MTKKRIFTTIAISVTSLGFSQTEIFPGTVEARTFVSDDPTDALHSTANDNFIGIHGGTSKFTGASILLYGSAAGAGHASDLDFVSQDVQFQVGTDTNQIYAMTLNEIGNVGIGTTDPKYKLSIAGGRFNVEANGDYYGFWVDNKARNDNPQFNLGKWHNYRSSFIYDSTYNWLRLETQHGSDIYPNTMIFKGGKVGIMTTNLSHALSVNGTIRSKEIIVDTGWSDFVFEESYRLKPLSEVESHIEKHGHLPDVPSASVVESEGLSVGEGQKIMMQKIEELTLYVIAQDKKIEAQQLRIQELESN